MPQVDFTYWWAHAKPGPKYPCTTSTGTPPTFDNDAGTTSAPNNSIAVNGEMAPLNTDYTCKVIENGIRVGELSWNHTTHDMTIYGTVFVDGNFRFDNDGQVVHYHGRGDIFSGGAAEIDALVCAGGSGTDPGHQLLRRHEQLGPVPGHARPALDVHRPGRVRPGRHDVQPDRHDLLPERVLRLRLPGRPLLEGRLPDPPDVPRQRAR